MSEITLASKGYVESKIGKGKEYVDFATGPVSIPTVQPWQIPVYGKTINYYLLSNEKKIEITHLFFPAVILPPNANYVALASTSETTVPASRILNDEPLQPGVNKNVWLKCSLSLENPDRLRRLVGECGLDT